MPRYKIVMTVEIVRYEDAENEQEAVDDNRDDMIHELKNYGVDPEFDVVEISGMQLSG